MNGSPLPLLAAASSLKEIDPLKLTADSPQTGQRSVSSSSNSPNSVRVNQEYVDKLKARSTSNVQEEDEGKEAATNSEDDIDMLDAKTPLLKEKSSAVIVESSCSNKLE